MYLCLGGQTSITGKPADTVADHGGDDTIGHFRITVINLANAIVIFARDVEVTSTIYDYPISMI